MNKAQRITGTLFVALGLYVTWYSLTTLKVGSINKPGPGFFTFVCGAGIFVLSAIWLFSILKKQDAKGPLWGKGQWLGPLLAIGLAFLYAVLMQFLGYIFSTMLFIILWQLLIAKGSRTTIIIFAVVGTAVMYFLFSFLLSVPLPRGVFGF